MNKKKIYLLIVVILVVIVGGGIVFALSQLNNTPVNKQKISDDKNDKEADRPENTTTKTPDSSANPTQKEVAANRCVANDLAAIVQTDNGGGAAGSVYATLTFTNRSEKSCSLNGFPGVSLLNGASEVGKPAERSGGMKSSVDLAPGEKAQATIRFVQAGDGCKDGANQLKVYAPNDTTEIITDTPKSLWCPGFSVTAVTKG